MKKQWIEAYEQTLNEYQNDVHLFDDEKCAKCILANRSLLNVPGRSGCEDCPESVFETDMSVGCISRRVKANDSRAIKEEHKSRLINYHILAIEELKKMKRWSLKEFQQKLVEINKSI